MVLISLYAAVTLTAVIWVCVDKDATAAFEFLRWNLHATARDMGMSGKFVRYSLGRLAILVSLVTANIAIALVMFVQNPLDFGLVGRMTLLVAMISGALAYIAFPRAAARRRFIRFLHSKTAPLAELVAIAQSEAQIHQHWEPTGYDTRGKWTAWHPRQQEFVGNSLWSGIVPVIYAKLGITPAMIVPVDFTSFLAWNLPDEVQPGEPLPFCGPGNTRFVVRAIYVLAGKQGWSIIRAELDDREGELAAA